MRYLANIVLLLSICFVPTVFAVAEVPGTIAPHSCDSDKNVTLTVEVVNATASGVSVEGDVVFLAVYHGQQQVSAKEVFVDSAGLAVFKNVSGGKHFHAVMRARHSDMMFSGQSIRLDCPGDDAYGKVEVYDVGLDNSVITVGTHHLSLKIEGQSLVVTEFMQLINATDKAVSSSNTDKGGEPKVIEISLPAGFSDLKFSKYFVESAVVATDDGFYDTMAIPPGAYDASFSYKIDLQKSVLGLQKNISISTKEFTVFSMLDGPVLEGAGQAEGKFFMADGTEAQYYAASSYSAGDKVALQVTGIEAAGYGRMLLVVTVAVVVLLVAAGVKRFKS